MAITFVGATSGTSTGTGVSLPGSYQDGDIVIAFAYNRNNTTVPGAPTGGTYTFVLNNSSAYTNRAVLYYRVISGDTTFPGFASSTSHYALAIYRGQNKGDPIGASSSTTNNTATMSYADFTEEYTDSTSWIVGCGGHRNNDSGSITHDSTWSNTTFYNHVDASNNGKVGIGSISDISSWGGDSVATLGTANGHSTITIELKAEKTLVADSASFTLTGQDVTLTYDGGGFTITADSGSFSLAGQDTSLEFGRLLNADNGSFTYSGNTAGLAFGRKLTADGGSYTLTGQDTNFLFNRLLAADGGSFALVGSDTGLLFARKMTGNSGSFTYTGGVADFLRGRILVADSGSFSLTGDNTTLLFNRKVGADSGTFTLTGQDAALVYDTGATEYTLVADNGIFVLTGDAVSLLFNRLVTAANGSFTLAGQDNNLLFNRLIASDNGSLGFTGGSANLLFNRVVQAASGTFILTGNTVNFSRTYVLAADSGSYSFSGENAGLIWSEETQISGGYDWLIKRRRRKQSIV